MNFTETNRLKSRSLDLDHVKMCVSHSTHGASDIFVLTPDSFLTDL